MTVNSPANSQLTDTFNRNINYLRVSVTDKCNLKCSYCVSHTPSPKLSHDDILRYEEIIRIVRIGASHGISKVRITGGEPFFRKGLPDFIEKLTCIKGLKDISLTTNGVLLKPHLAHLKQAGIKRLNISLDTLKKDRFKTITGVDAFDTVWDTILTAHRMGFSPIKINTVAIHGLNHDEIVDFAELSYSYPFHFRFIEYMPIGSPELTVSTPLLTPEIKQLVASRGDIYPIKHTEYTGPATRFKFEDGLGEIGFISPVSNHFCSICNRLRLTASGKLRACLLSDDTVDIAGPLRSGGSDKELYNCMERAIASKHEKHFLAKTRRSQPGVCSEMSSIGG